jgi:hypothetical protein
MKCDRGLCHDATIEAGTAQEIFGYRHRSRLDASGGFDDQVAGRSVPGPF